MDDSTGQPELDDERMLRIAPSVFMHWRDLRLQFARSGGPGGQNVNKLNTKAELWAPISAITGLDDAARHRLRALAGSRLTLADELHLVSQESRSQETNRKTAIERLRELVLRAMVAPKRRRPTKPSQGARRRRLQGKKRRSEIKQGRGQPDLGE